ncbi:Hypothetical_protein [Hexamita inflata]|uniref:Hypothetical_protein n=1 Tax=Hexamita inflata TaxID=28002 RepID=A0AA86PGU7_9EUKA|nr:Hypothetical protein HINF_LOCUS26719 [Hexamita inflata]CAI9939076.1 Hypothetical protein HINF_LOCUS26721 [Hexamita inflata]CAI9939078.1 Hypothetical protein HINF_LOCUS26723 [Hexamita inflata]
MESNKSFKQSKVTIQSYMLSLRSFLIVVVYIYSYIYSLKIVTGSVLQRSQKQINKQILFMFMIAYMHTSFVLLTVERPTVTYEYIGNRASVRYRKQHNISTDMIKDPKPNFDNISYILLLMECKFQAFLNFISHQ